MDFKELEKLVTLVENAGISHLSIDENGMKIEIKKEASPSYQMTVPAQAPVVQQPVVPAPAATDQSVAKDDNLIEVTSQMVGTFYASSSPESAPFVKVGDTVSSGQVICVVEAMKLFNEIESEVSGVVEQICVSNEQSVEFGQTLFILRK
jgi:acetyl-CoA carboxylase biotin carboxyl carrier protein